MSAAAEWWPYPRWLMSRILLLSPSSFENDRPSSTAARIRSRLTRTAATPRNGTRLCYHDPAFPRFGSPRADATRARRKRMGKRSRRKQRGRPKEPLPAAKTSVSWRRSSSRRRKSSSIARPIPPSLPKRLPPSSWRRSETVCLPKALRCWSPTRARSSGPAR